MVNKYPGNCVGCNRRVFTRQGIAFRRGGHWAVTHVECSDTSRLNAPKISRHADTYTNCNHEDYPCCGCG